MAMLKQCLQPRLKAVCGDFVYAEVWNRLRLGRRSRYLISLAGAVLAGADADLVEASGNCTSDEMQEFLLHYGLHAGWPKASIAQFVVLKMSRKVAAGLPWNG